MKKQVLTLVAVVTFVTGIGQAARADDMTDSGLQIPASVQEETGVAMPSVVKDDAGAPSTPVAGSSQTQPETQPVLPEPAPEPPGTPSGVAESGGPKPWTLPEPCALKSLGIHQYGWLEQGATFNSLSPANGWNGPVVCNDRSNDYEMNQLWVGWERPVNTHGCGWDIGGRIDVVYGSDWRYGDCYGLESTFDARNQLYGLILPQFYLDVAYNDLTVRMGHYAASIGYEVVAAPGNFFYSHSYALGYSEPVLVTGLQADYKVNDNWNVIGGFHRGWNMFEDDNTELDFLGGAKWHAEDHKTSLSWMMDIGPQDPAGKDDQWVYSLVFTRQITEKLTYAAEHVMGGGVGEDPRTGGYAKWWGLDQYLIYTLNPCWSFGARAEVFRDQDGARVAGVGNVSLGWTGQPGFAGTFTEATVGLNWHPHPNIVVRPECRWDCYSGTTNIQNQLPFGDGNRSSQFLYATDVIFTF